MVVVGAFALQLVCSPPSFSSPVFLLPILFGCLGCFGPLSIAVSMDTDEMTGKKR
jgi:hypothetical protein